MHACDRNRSLRLPVINQEVSMIIIIIIIKISHKKRKRKLNISFKYPNHTQPYHLIKKTNKQNPKNQSSTIKYQMQSLNIHPSLQNQASSSSKKKEKSTKSKGTRPFPHFFFEISNTTLSRVRIICIIHRYVIARGNEWASKAARVTDVCSSE